MNKRGVGHMREMERQLNEYKKLAENLKLDNQILKEAIDKNL